MAPTSLAASLLRQRTIATATELGFNRVGVVSLAQPQRYRKFLDWLDSGFHGEMGFLDSAAHRGGRAGFDTVLEGAKSAVVVAAAYSPKSPEPAPGRGRVARYAFGDDYHYVLKQKLGQLATALQEAVAAPVHFRACVDTAPVLERELAQSAGIGFIGKNTMLISPGIGSYTVLGELFTTAEISPTDSDGDHDHCGQCRACLDACPTNAFPEAYVLDARLCISYLTIEHRSAIPSELREPLGQHVYGCDICQEVCPYNARAPHRTEPISELNDSESVAQDPALTDLATLTSGDYRRLTRRSAMSRARRGMLRRNAILALGNAKKDSAVVRECLGDSDPIIRGASAWALGRQGDTDALERALSCEKDGEVRKELMEALAFASASARGE